MRTRYNRIVEAVLTSTHNLCFGAKIRKYVYPCIPQFCYIKVGFEGVYITRTCFRNVGIFCAVWCYTFIPVFCLGWDYKFIVSNRVFSFLTLLLSHWLSLNIWLSVRLKNISKYPQAHRCLYEAPVLHLHQLLYFYLTSSHVWHIAI